MKSLPAGTFTMGYDAAEYDERPVHKVTISAFKMSATEITNAQYEQFRPTHKGMRGVKRTSFNDDDPVVFVSYDDAIAFCKWLSKKEGKSYRLPTEAEWEYACRAGAKTTYFFGNDPALLNHYAWTKTNSKGKYQKVGQKKPNAWGLHDMLGNVAEWTLDQYNKDYFATASDTDPLIRPTTRYPRSVRGGSYLDDAASMRSAARKASAPEWNVRDPQIPKSRWWLTDGMFIGFRIVRPLNQPSKEEIENFYKLYLGK